ncbi:MAG: autotransporter strand-loop-strand O-heptosyltransferase [Kiritimatiellae bacterium]|nr:autotransporter strand-loop-strand O-heptosyltransferase [Kiritimatiellia bacterium]
MKDGTEILDPDPFRRPPPPTPTQEGPRGIRYDFNDGARVLLPKGAWHVELEDDESGNMLFSCDADEGWVTSTKKYYVPFRIRVWDRADMSKPVLDHLMDLRGKPVLLKFSAGALGDTIAWFPYAEKFQKKHGCAVECTMSADLVELLAAQYPEMTLSAVPEVKTAEPYASYRVGLFFGGDQTCQPYDFRQVGLAQTAGHILGVDPQETPPRMPPPRPRTVMEPYVCIAAKGTNLAKSWLNGFGWEQVVEHLKSLGYRVLCIDRDRTSGQGWTWNHIPYGAEDFTGNLPLPERVALLQHAEFFVGLSSGLSWLAWAAGTPVVLISGFSLPICEFQTPYRVHNTHVCHGCWNASDVTFDRTDYFWCPRHKGTDSQFECTRAITGRQVIRTIERLRADRGLVAPKERK